MSKLTQAAQKYHSASVPGQFGKKRINTSNGFSRDKVRGEALKGKRSQAVSVVSHQMLLKIIQ
jgi:hypothetical protein